MVWQLADFIISARGTCGARISRSPQAKRLLPNKTMRAAVPLSLQQDLTQRANELLRNVKRLGDIPVFELRRLMSDLDRLAAVDRVTADDIRSTLYLLSGQDDAAEACIRNIERLGSPGIAAFRRLVHSINLLKSAESRESISKCFDVGFPSLVNVIESGMSVGAFSLVNSLIDQAQQRNLVIVDAVAQIAKTRLGAAVLNKLSITDEQIGKVIDVAGDMLRSRKLVWLNDMPDIRISGDISATPGVLMAYRVDVSPSEAADMTCELVERQIAQDIDLQGFSVCFIGTDVGTEN